MAGPLSINGIDVATLGFRLSAPPGWLDIPARTHPQAVRPTRPGALLSGPIYEGTRKLTFNGVVDATTADLARSNRDALIAAILQTQPARIIMPDQVTRYIDAYLETKTTDATTGPVLISRTLRTVLNFLILNPYYCDITATTTTLDATIRRLQLGTAPSYPVLTISGASTNPIFSLFKYDGTLLGTIGLTLSTVGGDTLIVDTGAKTIKKNGATQIVALTAGDFFALDPAVAQLGLGTAAGDRPYITVNSGAGTSVFNRSWR